MIERQEGHAVQDMRVVERIGEDSRDEDRRDPVRWIVQVILLTLVSPALLAVLMVSGVFLSVQKIATMTDRVFSTERPGLKVIAGHNAIQKPATPA
jgi:hypothetical protein